MKILLISNGGGKAVGGDLKMGQIRRFEFVVFFPFRLLPKIPEKLFFSSFSVFFRDRFFSRLRASGGGFMGAGFYFDEARDAPLQVSAL